MLKSREGGRIPQAVIFDMDGVLVDSTEAHYLAWLDVCRERGFEPTRGEFHETIGTGNDVTVRMLFGGEWTPEAIAELAGRKEAAYRDAVRDSLEVIDGAADLVEALDREGWRLALGTSAPPENVDCVMARFPAAARLAVKVNAGMVREAKPAPDLFLRAAELLGARPADCIVIEDSLMGLEAAKRAGMVGVGLTTTLGRERLAAKAALVADSLRELTPARLLALIRDRSS